MTTEQKHEIEIPGLPEGWRVKEIRLWDALYEITPGSHNYNPCINTARFKCELIVEKIKPRRIVLEETDEERVVYYGDWFEDECGFVSQWNREDTGSLGCFKIWRVVEEE